MGMMKVTKKITKTATTYTVSDGENELYLSYDGSLKISCTGEHGSAAEMDIDDDTLADMMEWIPYAIEVHLTKQIGELSGKWEKGG